MSIVQKYLLLIKNDVEIIVSNNCTFSGCHDAGSSNGDFTTYTGIKTKVDDGSLESRVLIQKNMPPTAPLSTVDLNKIQCWINNGSPKN